MTARASSPWCPNSSLSFRQRGAILPLTQSDTAVIDEAIGQLEKRAGAAIFVAAAGDQIAAFIHVRAVEDYYLRQAQAHVADLVVAPDAHGHGLGSRLLSHAEGWAQEKGYTQLTIAVFEANAEALALYERRGFCREIVRLIKPI